VKYEWYFVNWRGFPYYLRSYCVNNLSWNRDPHSHFVHGAYFCYFMIFLRIWFITFGIRGPVPGFCFLNIVILEFFL
jgi:hypothetical protein